MDNREAIDSHWQRRSADNPNYFNGTIHLSRGLRIDEECLTAELLKTDFKSFLYWREAGYPDAGVCDAFGSALIRTAEGHVILGRQKPGNVNGGLAYLPGGFIDERDIGDDGRVDIADSVWREVGEETGLRSCELVRAPGLLVTTCGPQVSIAVEYRSDLSSEELCDRIRAHIKAETDPELEDVVVARTAPAPDCADYPLFARLVLSYVLGGRVQKSRLG